MNGGHISSFIQKLENDDFIDPNVSIGCASAEANKRRTVRDSSVSKQPLFIILRNGHPVVKPASLTSS
jgi:hypothetical protein